MRRRTHAHVDLELGANHLRLELGDDGRGFDPERAVARGHHGLANMRARTSVLGATLTVTSDATSGTRIIVALPTRQDPERGPR